MMIIFLPRDATMVMIRSVTRHTLPSQRRSTKLHLFCLSYPGLAF